MVRVLVVDDDPEIVDLLKLDFELLGFEVEAATDGLSGLKKAETTAYDLIMLDVMMPRQDGYETCKKIRALPPENSGGVSNGATVPIILLTAKGTLEDKVRGFNAGADDYLLKPFEFQELMVRVRALFRRSGVLQKGMLGAKENATTGEATLKTKPEVLAAGPLRLLPGSLEVVVDGRLMKLTPTEFEILYCLMQHVGQAVPLATLLKEVWGYDASEDVRMLRVHMGGLRQKLEPDPKAPTYLQTVTHVGYRLMVEASEAAV